MTVSGKRSPVGRGVTALALTLVTVVSGVAALASCSTGEGDQANRTFSPRPTPPDTASFSGMPPSLMSSAAASALASASAAASSASAAASAFEASVSAETLRANEAAAAVLEKVSGGGNAGADVSLRGKPRAETGGLLAVIVSITNRTDKKASYAVQVDFRDGAGKVVESRIVGAEGLEPGELAQPLAISRKPADLNLTPRIEKAQRY
ncbi:hypothetical protein [Streptomyces sp. NBC_01244]|uniref:hypothetical protein n=1 Tax=Streptomyces sp. NBC_01244 TaxID=2903797 RepID=UPI002E0F5495|nr:hypothetical protein OG247_34105 [Streptomyces sp. NBC_01244]